LSPDDDRVTQRELAAALTQTVSLREFTDALNSLRGLYAQLDSNRAETSRLRHESIGNTLDRLEASIKGISIEMKLHAVEDAKVEDRVSKVEDTQKRMTWVMFAALPSFLAAWEYLKKVLKLG